MNRDASSSTQTSGKTGHKTRHFSNIVSELATCLRIHSESGSKLNGVSLEFTGEMNEDGFSVTECLGGSMGLGEGDLGLRYQVRGLATSGKSRGRLIVIVLDVLRP